MGRPSPAAYRKSKLDPCVEESLRKHGEAFMSMFDDNSDDEGRGNVSNGPNEPIDGGADLENTPQECRPPIMATSKRKKQKKKDKHGQDNATGPKPNSAPRKREQDELDDIFASRPAIRPTQKRATTSKREAEERLLREREDEMLRRKVERKRFMSSSADSMYSFDEEARLREAKQRLDRSRSAGHGPDKKKEMEEFKAIRREIQSFGAKGLDKKSRAKFEQDRLVELGARKQKGVRTSAKIGCGMAKKAAWREQRSIDEAIASGMVSRKAIAEKKRRTLKKERSGQDRGLFEDGGRFNAKSGVMRI